MAATVQHEELYGMWKHNIVAYTVAATVQHEQLYSMWSLMAYTVAVTVKHGQLYSTWQHRTLAHKMAATVQHEATVQHALAHNTVAYTVAQLYTTAQQHITLWHTQCKQLYGTWHHRTLA